MTKAGGWLPQSGTRSELDDPLLQQIGNIESFLQQARLANRTDEVAMLEENLRQLQDEFDAQQTRRAIQLSRKLAEETDLQQRQIEHLEQRELENKVHTKMASLDFRDNVQDEEQDGGDLEDHLSADLESKPTKSGNSPPVARHKEEPTPQARNPFDAEDFSPVEDGATSSSSVEIKRENSHAANGKKEYNPFEEEDSDYELDVGTAKSQGNPFEDEDGDEDRGNPFKEVSDGNPAGSTNPFDEDDDASMDDMIEEELLLQQIDNIRAYMFDAKLNGRADEVELLSENLRELHRTLQEQKRKK